MTNPATLLIIVSCLAGLIVLGTVIAIIRVLSQPAAKGPSTVSPSASSPPPEESSARPPSPADTLPLSDAANIDTYLADQRANLGEFALKDLSNSFKGTTQENQRLGVILHLNDPDLGLVAFTSQVSNPQNGHIMAETTYGKMELLIREGRAGIKWDGKPLGILDYTNQRILGPQAQQLLGSLERPLVGSESGYYAIGFFGRKVADVTTAINALSTLRWFDDEDSRQMPAFQNLADELDDEQTLLLLGALLLEMGFMDLLREF